jgi:hypothetical protein
MKKFVFLYYGAWPGEPTREIMDAWTAWFASIGENLVDGGNPLGPGREVTAGASTDLTEASPITGYSIVSADSMDDAEKLLVNCPIIDGVRIYEAMSM